MSPHRPLDAEFVVMSTFEPLAVSVSEATKLSGLSRSFLYEAMAAKELPFIKAGRRRLIAFDDLRRWLATHRVEAA